jgi:carboxylate-amine ligase
VQIDFSASERASLGVEWELELVDVETRQLRSGSNEVLAAITRDGLDEHP